MIDEVDQMDRSVSELETRVAPRQVRADVVVEMDSPFAHPCASSSDVNALLMEPIS